MFLPPLWIRACARGGVGRARRTRQDCAGRACQARAAQCVPATRPEQAAPRRVRRVCRVCACSADLRCARTGRPACRCGGARFVKEKFLPQANPQPWHRILQSWPHVDARILHCPQVHCAHARGAKPRGAPCPWLGVLPLLPRVALPVLFFVLWMPMGRFDAIC